MTLQYAIVPDYLGKRRTELGVENLNSNHDQGLATVLIEEQEERPFQPQPAVTQNHAVQLHHISSPSDGNTNRLLRAKHFDWTVPTAVDIVSGSAQAVREEGTNATKMPSAAHTDFREDLKKKILERRRAAGKQMINLALEEENRRKQQEKNQLTQEDIERRMKKRQSNNKAAKRCRENRKQQEVIMEKEMSVQKRRKNELLQALVFLQKEKTILETIWKDCSRGEISDETRRSIQAVINTDYTKFVPEPLPVIQVTLDSDNSNGAFDKDGSDEHDGTLVTNDDARRRTSSSFEGFEVKQSDLFSEMFQRPNMTNKKTHSIDSTERSSDTERNDPSENGSGINKREAHAGNKYMFVDNDVDSGIDNDLFGSQSSTDSNSMSYQGGGVRARNTLLDLAEATYSEMNEAEELVKPMCKLETCTEDTREEDGKAMADDSDIDEEDFLPLVIDLAK